MNPTCDIVAERVALGEPLGDVAEHAESCPKCRRLAALPAELGATRRVADPGMGFAARMTAGAQHRVTVRRRRRIAVGLATAVAASGAGVFLVTRQPPQSAVATQPAPSDQRPAADPNQKDPWNDGGDQPSADDDVKALLQLADVDRPVHRARWKDITKPLAPYRALVKGIEP